MFSFQSKFQKKKKNFVERNLLHQITQKRYLRISSPDSDSSGPSRSVNELFLHLGTYSNFRASFLFLPPSFASVSVCCLAVYFLLLNEYWSEYFVRRVWRREPIGADDRIPYWKNCERIQHRLSFVGQSSVHEPIYELGNGSTPQYTSLWDSLRTPLPLVEQFPSTREKHHRLQQVASIW